MCFTELRLDELADDPERGAAHDLPYPNISHLRQCLVDTQDQTVHTKMVDRVSPASFPYRTIKNGIFIGTAHEERMLYYSLPSQQQLRAEHYHWWRSVNI